MEYRNFLIKYAEIGTKGKNRYVFEDCLVHDISRKLRSLGDFRITRERGRIYVACKSPECGSDDVILCLKKVFGIASICPMIQFENNGSPESLEKKVLDYFSSVYADKKLTFKVETRRADKSFPLKSNEIDASIGEAILNNFPSVSVDVHDPEVRIRIEIRNHINLYSEEIKGQGGMPLGSTGKAMLLLSGGIDSPVAGYMVSRRGATIEAVYFHAPPYTSERAKQKVVDLAREISVYTGPIALHVVNFTDIQLKIYEDCPHEELTIIMRRYMMRIAEELAVKSGAIGLITGESIGQVASQTMESLVSTNEVCTLPVYRPLIAFDKQDIVEISKEIGTYETSIEPFEDCCTIFVAKHPVTKPDREKIRISEGKIFDALIPMCEKAVNEAELIWVK